MMEKKASSCNSILCLFLFFFFFLCSLTGKTSSSQVIPVKVGVVIQMDFYGETALTCISMALSDFYATHGHYRTRLVLTNRDSKDDVIGAAAAALDLLKNVQVQAIIGPVYSSQANFLISLGDRARVPIITFSATSPSLSSLRSPYFIRATLKDSSQVNSISAIVKAFRWREVVPIHVDNEFGEGIMPFLADALENVNARVPYRSVIPPLATDDQISSELYKLKTMRTRVFVVHMLGSLASRFFSEAKRAGMMSREYAWIITDGVANELGSMDRSVIESMLGVIGVRPYVPKTKELDDFSARFASRVLTDHPRARSLDLGIYRIWAYDAAVALAVAAEKAVLSLTTNLTMTTSNVSGSNVTELEAIGVSHSGPDLIRALSETTFKGLAGDFRLVDGQLHEPPFEIINMVGPGARVIGYWTEQNGLTRELISSEPESKLGPIIWPGDTNSPPKGWVVPTSGKVLRVGVPVKEGFTEFVRVTWNPDNSTSVEGNCIDVFKSVMSALPYGVSYEYIPFATSDHVMAGSYNDLIYQVYLGKFDAVAGDVTIVANRSEYVDFTLPFMGSGVSMIVPVKGDQNQNGLVLLKPLTWEVWVTCIASCIFIGCVLRFLERRNQNDGPFWLFAFITIMFVDKEKVQNNLSKFMLIAWLLVVIILTQVYTANLASMLTVQQLHPTVKDIDELIKGNEYVGFLKGSFVYDLMKTKFNSTRLVQYDSMEQLEQLLYKGSRHGGVAAAFEEIPYIKLFLSKYCKNYTMVELVYKADGFGFVFPMGFPLVPDVSRAILKVTEGGKMAEIEKRWLGTDNDRNKLCPDGSSALTPKSLGIASFWPLFVAVLLAGVLVFIIHVYFFLRDNWDIVVNPDPLLSIWDKMRMLLNRFPMNPVIDPPVDLPNPNPNPNPNPIQ